MSKRSPFHYLHMITLINCTISPFYHLHNHLLVISKIGPLNHLQDVSFQLHVGCYCSIKLTEVITTIKLVSNSSSSVFGLRSSVFGLWSLKRKTEEEEDRRPKTKKEEEDKDEDRRPKTKEEEEEEDEYRRPKTEEEEEDEYRR